MKPEHDYKRVESRTESKTEDLPPGAVLLRRFLALHRVSPEDLAQGTALDIGTVHSILQGSIGITPALGAMLDDYLGTGSGFWHMQQWEYDAAHGRERRDEARDVLACFLLPSLSRPAP
ncbi:helix-turn-helix transcriptional regulator [Undibacterium sp. TJN25]|uniref:helix-turn-helix transcriptional regulator n=1 Tax=Undibacterium sp. TJN25 TaxID=3413056 RepID=UPI003BF39B73